MRQLSRLRKEFSFSHFTYNRDTMKAGGLRHVRRAFLRKAAGNERLKNADFKLYYTDIDSGEKRVCWQPLLAFFNGMKVVP